MKPENLRTKNMRIFSETTKTQIAEQLILKAIEILQELLEIIRTPD